MSDVEQAELSVDLSLDIPEPHLPPYTHRRIRHISSIQVRNLTPFPVRDAVASALSLPSEQSQFTSHGHHSDDLDISLTMKRSRRISLNSVHTLRSVKSEDSSADTSGTGDTATISKGRARAASRASTVHSTVNRPGAGSAPTLRPRKRTNSNASSLTSTHVSTSYTNGTAPAAAYRPVFQDHTQTGLEKVITTRLVETFLSITVKPTDPPEESGPLSPVSPSFGKHSPHSPISPTSMTRKSLVSKSKRSNGAETPKGHRASASTVERIRIQDPPSPRVKGHVPTHAKSASTSSPRVQTKSAKIFPNTSSSSPPSPAASTPSPSDALPVPNFLSPIHPPSTNPLFPIDSTDFASWTDLSGEELVVEIWAKDIQKRLSNGKGKERSWTENGEDWNMLDEWNFNLADLVPLSDDLHAHLSQLPSNTLLLTLDPPGRSFYLLSPRIPHTRSPSPSAGYASDPEVAGKVRHVKDIFSAADSDEVPTSRRRYRRGTRRKSQSPESVSKTATWQDLFKLVSLQSCIQDTKSSLDEIIRGIDKSVGDDISAQLTRQLNQREARLLEHQEDLHRLRALCQERETDLATRRERLKQRREMLLMAKTQLRDGAIDLSVTEQSASEERARLDFLRSRIKPTRTTLLSILATIFPIELRSPPDLLYTILDVPLPIPVASTDPAPPFSLPAHKDINEDTVATALGYAAHVVHFVALYLGKGLVYPITYVGSRSMIRDGISGMVGPRMFPLFSKGVDTYRFEYGVFLLNKDIELLMAEHDLRALDMRHTLPNLKNLLLTLTNGEGLPVGTTRPCASPELSVSGLESPRPESPVGESPTTPKASDAELRSDVRSESGTPPPSGTTTPTSTTETIKKGRGFGMNLNPLSLSSLGFLSLRRYPASLISRTPSDADGTYGDDDSSTSHSESSSPVLEATDEDNVGGDEDDRRTIRGTDTGNGVGEAAPEDEVKSNGLDAGGREKVLNPDAPETAATRTSTTIVG